MSGQKTMRDIVKSRVTWTALSVWALFFPLASILSIEDLFAYLTGLSFTAAIAVVMTYWPAMWLALKMEQSDLDYVDFLTLGILCTWFASSGRIAYLQYYRIVGVTPIIETYPLAFFQWMNFTGALLHLSARRVIRGTVPTTNWPKIWLVVTIGGVLGSWIAATN